MKEWMRKENILVSLKDKISQFSFKQRKFAVFVIILSFSLTLVLMTLVNFLVPFFAIPSFSFDDMKVTDLDETSMTVDFTINLSKPVLNTIKVELITCQLNYESNGSTVFLGSGKTLKSFLIPRNTQIISNVSLKFNFIDVKDFLETLANRSMIEFTGKVYFTGGFSHSFTIETSSIGENILPDFDLMDIHPIPPGNRLEANVRLVSPHTIILNITKGKFDLRDKARGLLGTAEFYNVDIPQGTTIVSLYLNMNQTELEWMFEEILNNNTFSPEIQNLNLTLRVKDREFSLFMKEGSTLDLDMNTKSLEILGVESISYSLSENIFSFDLILGLRGYPLWGYNLTNNVDSNLSVYLDFYHKLLNQELQLVGNGSSNKSVSISKDALVRVPVHIIVFPFASAEMTVVWLRDQTISINIKNGLINLEMYDFILNISFERQI
ncbi:MAG: hypothetical protein ACTSR2_02745 [Candidatus Hodarchaeales archaeon]